MKMARGIVIRLRYEVVVRDRNGKVLSRESRLCKSLLTFFAKWFRMWHACACGNNNPPTFSSNDTAGGGRTVPYQGARSAGSFGSILAPSGYDTGGMRIGTSNIAVDPADYELKARIVHGTGGGQMLYGAQSVESVEVVGAISKFRNTRVFTNNSGGLITVKEIGSAMYMRDTVDGDRTFLYCRDVLAVPKDVPDGSTITVRYTMSVTA